METDYCRMKDGCIFCDRLLCEGKRSTDGMTINPNEMKKVFRCNRCGKEIGNLECYESAKILRKRVPDGDPKIFDVWFMDYCNDCAKEMDVEKELGVVKV